MGCSEGTEAKGSGGTEAKGSGGTEVKSSAGTKAKGSEGTEAKISEGTEALGESRERRQSQYGASGLFQVPVDLCGH